MGFGPVLTPGNIHYEVSERVEAICWGGLGVIQQMAEKLEVAGSLDEGFRVLRRHLPYRESDHVLSLIYNVMSGGSCLQDAEEKRRDRVYLKALGASRLPAPSTSGDFLRRFEWGDVEALQEAFHEPRLKVWSSQPESFRDLALIDADGTSAPTSGECKEGMDVSYKGVWGYAPLVVSLANTREVLYTVNRPGNRPSHEGAAEYLDRAVDLMREAGFRKVRLRGDTAFDLTSHFDRWSGQGVEFVFGKNAQKGLVRRAEEVPESEWIPLKRRGRKGRKGRCRRDNVKARIVARRGYKNQRLQAEHVTEWEHRPARCKRAYRLVVLRKTISMEKGQRKLFDEKRYFFYITNVPAEELSAGEVVAQSNARCDQENVIEQLKNGVAALRMPSDSLESNWAWMVIASQAWNFKIWLALLLEQRRETRRLLRMEFRRFLHGFIQLPCQILNRGGRLIYRLLGQSPWMDLLLEGSIRLRREPLLL